MDDVALERVSLGLYSVLAASHHSYVAPYSSPPTEMADSPEQAAQYYFDVSSLTHNLTTL
jgi:hypothetical protein